MYVDSQAVDNTMRQISAQKVFLESMAKRQLAIQVAKALDQDPDPRNSEALKDFRDIISGH